MLGLNKQKKAFVSLSYQFKGEALIELINYTDMELVITDRKGYEAITPYLNKTNIRIILILKETGDFEVYEFISKPRREITDIDEDTFGICFTSGSTSTPKASNNALKGTRVLPLSITGGTSIFNFLPFMITLTSDSEAIAVWGNNKIIIAVKAIRHETSLFILKHLVFL
jgi:long-chain acyl-CoA synthetase